MNMQTQADQSSSSTNIGVIRCTSRFYIKKRQQAMSRLLLLVNRMQKRSLGIQPESNILPITNLIFEQPGAVPWSDGISCYICSAEFTLWHRKHHCRLCGKTICNECSVITLNRSCKTCSQLLSLAKSNDSGSSPLVILYTVVINLHRSWISSKVTLMIVYLYSSLFSLKPACSVDRQLAQSKSLAHLNDSGY